MTVSRILTPLLLALGLVAGACAGDEPEAQTGLAETEVGGGAPVAGATEDGDGTTGGSNDGAGTAQGDGSTAEGGSNAATAVPVGDGGSDAKRVAATTIDDLNEIEPAATVDFADVVPVVFDEPNEGEIETGFGVDRWTFDGESGVMIAVDVLEIGNDCRQDLTLVLEAPSGLLGDGGWIGNGGCRVHGPFLLEESGTHVLEFRGGDGAVIDSTTGAYRFVPYVLTERDVAPVVFDEPVDGEISELLGVDRWTFDASAGQLLIIDVVSIGDNCRQDLKLTLEDPFAEREEIAWVGNSGCRLYDPIEIGQDGTHVIEFHGGDASIIDDPTGPYQFTVSLLS